MQEEISRANGTPWISETLGALFRSLGETKERKRRSGGSFDFE